MGASILDMSAEKKDLTVSLEGLDKICSKIKILIANVALDINVNDRITW